MLGASNVWTGIQANASSFFTAVSPLVRFGVGFALAVAVVGIGMRVLRARRLARQRGIRPVTGYPAGAAGGIGSASVAMGGRASMPRLRLRERVPDYREWRTHAGTQEVYSKSGERID